MKNSYLVLCQGGCECQAVLTVSIAAITFLFCCGLYCKSVGCTSPIIDLTCVSCQKENLRNTEEFLSRHGMRSKENQSRAYRPPYNWSPKRRSPKEKKNNWSWSMQVQKSQQRYNAHCWEYHVHIVWIYSSNRLPEISEKHHFSWQIFVVAAVVICFVTGFFVLF